MNPSTFVGPFKYLVHCHVSIMKPTWCTFLSIDWESRAFTCFEHYLLILRRCYTNGAWYIACVQPWHSQLTLYARNIPSAVCWKPPEDEQAMLDTCRGSWFSINLMKSASRWFHYTDILWCRSAKHWTLSRVFLLCCVFESLARSSSLRARKSACITSCLALCHDIVNVLPICVIAPDTVHVAAASYHWIWPVQLHQVTALL
jgi:hypothetical protein